MSTPQQSGDLTLPWPSGHFEIWTADPSSVVRLSSTSALPHLAQEMFTDIPHFSHEYVAMTFILHRAIRRPGGMVPRVLPRW